MHEDGKRGKCLPTSSTQGGMLDYYYYAYDDAK
jgi:hypothetical protein